MEKEGKYHNSHFNKQKSYHISNNMKVTLNIKLE